MQAICSVLNVRCFMKNFHSDAEWIPSFGHCMILEQTTDKQNFSKIQCGHSCQPERNKHKSTSFMLMYLYWKYFSGRCLWPHRIIQKTWRKFGKSFVFRVPNHVVYYKVANCDLDLPNFFINRYYELSPLKIHMNYIDIFSSLWGHFTGPSHDT